jgi:cytochrome P450
MTTTVKDDVNVEATATPEDGAESLATFDFRDPNFMADAYDRYAAFRVQGPVTRVRFGVNEPADEEERRRQEAFGRDAYLVTHYDEGTEALLDPRLSVDRFSTMTPEQRAEMEKMSEEDKIFLPLRRNLLSVDPPDHTRLRKLVQPSFTARAMEALKPRIRQIAEELLQIAEREAAARGETAPNRTMDLVRSFAYPLPVTVISEMVGIPVEDRAKVRGWTENLLSADRGEKEREAEVREQIGEFITYLKDLFERRRQDPKDDLISQLVQAEEDGDKLDEDELLAMVFIVYIAGFVTTVNLIGNGVVALLTHPDQLARFKADPSLASNVVEETLRYWGPAESTLPRTTTAEMQVGETVIPQGERVMMSLASMDRDPARFVNPEQYDIMRPDSNRHVAFGKGIHVCLGAPLARVEGQIAFEVLFNRLPDLRLAVPAEEIQWAPNFLRGFREIPLLF